MADFIRNPVVALPDSNPTPHFSDDELKFTDDEKVKISHWVSQYPTSDGAVMWTLWLAQEKFGFLPPEVLQLVATELALPYAQVYGVATFYTQYFKEKKGKVVLDVCTCFSCQFTGGYDVLAYLEEKLEVKRGHTSKCGRYTLQEAECLGACGSAPMMQVNNGPYAHHLTPDKIDELLKAMELGQPLPFVSITLPQDEDEMGGNRRTDADAVEQYATPPRSKRTD
ncbi:MAG: NAD(P)H-dependent oxidoreductase subunit E [Bacteroidetes bacterium]|nr:NAD(P)H-dependent oxidoreductase subunit E [Bacteroidota bacterium]